MIDTRTIPITYATLAFLSLLIVFVIGIQITSYIINILLLSLVLTMLIYPCVRWMKQKGIPDLAAVAIITGGAVLIIIGLVLLILASLGQLIADIPFFQAELQERLADIFTLFDRLGIERTSVTHPTINLQSTAMIISQSMLGLSEALLYIFFIAITTFFALLEAPKIPARIRKIYGSAENKSLSQFARMSRFMVDFVVVRTETNIVHGVLFGAFLYVMGVHSAILWGIMTIILGYIPYIGLIIAALPAIFFAWLQFGIWGAVAVIVAVILLNIVVENPVYAHLASKRFEMPALVVIISLIFWSWTLGVVGLVFAVPFTLLIMIVLQSNDETRWINTLVGVDQIFEEIAEGQTGEIQEPG
ncbi:AI-2E family transporter [Methanocalculus taiwanensis]|uniref:AI-2E family transporter n=1 Tax=Methanocalculus taiwanensis TaxID=106207 RepID=A0ABD4TMP2_9EURY|nr:AI-2E family transporter [Methanocalculus taiwanensis]MCQ1538882.1 AI-2E family transporter [Methanocalculus taiwanensis]